MKPLALLVMTALGSTACTAHLNVLERREPGDGGASILSESGGSGSRATDVSAGYSETCAALGNGLACWGTLPDGRVTNVPELVLGAGSSRWERISSGQRAHCGVQTGGSAWCFGVDDMGQLGQGDRQTRLTPAPVPLPSAASRVRGRFGTFCARLQDGALYCWGGNAEGQLGQNEPFTGPAPDAVSPVRVGSTNDFVDSDSGQGHTCLIRSGGELWCMGRNTESELGLGAGADVQIRTPTRVGDATDWTAIATGQGCSCGIRAPGNLYCWGDGRDGQLGLGARAIVDSPTRVGTDSDWTAVDVDTFHGCGLRGGTLHCWGRNAEGQLGQGDANDRDVPAAVGSSADWVQIAVGRFHTCMRRSDGTVWCMGDNDDGRLGTGDFDRRNAPTLVNLP